jgi:hypothetical protein
MISRSFSKGFPGRGLIFDADKLNEFFEKFGLKSDFRNPHESPEVYEEADLFLKNSIENGDVIMAYNLAGLEKRPGESGHVSLIREFELKSNKVTLADCILDNREIGLREFIANMNPWINKNYGFYAVQGRGMN